MAVYPALANSGVTQVVKPQPNNDGLNFCVGGIHLTYSTLPASPQPLLHQSSSSTLTSSVSRNLLALPLSVSCSSRSHRSPSIFFFCCAASGPAMESTITKKLETSLLSSADVVYNPTGKVTNDSDHEDSPKVHCGPEEIRSILEVIASTGKFWHDWEMLKNFLSFQLNQVLAQYPESKLASGVELQQISLSGETYPELVKRLDEALLGFTEGPPFTLQRICEILLNPKNTYRTLSKLALALEKNLLVTSTLSRCTDPYPATQAEGSAEQSEATHYGAVNKNDNEDEEMVDAEADVDIESKGLDVKEEKDTDVSTADLERNSVSNPTSQAP